MQCPFHKKLQYHNLFHNNWLFHYLGHSCLLVHLCDQSHDLSKGVFCGLETGSESFHQPLPLGKAGWGLLQGESKDSETASFISSSCLRYHFWDIKGKTINGAVGCPTFLGRERKEKQRERWRIPMEATPLLLGCYVRWVTSISQL